MGISLLPENQQALKLFPVPDTAGSICFRKMDDVAFVSSRKERRLCDQQ